MDGRRSCSASAIPGTRTSDRSGEHGGAGAAHCGRSDAARRAARHVQPVERKTTHARFRSRPSRRNAPAPAQTCPAAAGAPFGTVNVEPADLHSVPRLRGRLSREARSLDSKDSTAAKFIERNCVQCGLCAQTCPRGRDHADAAVALAAQCEERRGLERNGDRSIACAAANHSPPVRSSTACSGGSSGHSMFAIAIALRRLQMCADCRVLDMMPARRTRQHLRISHAARKSEACKASADSVVPDEDQCRRTAYALISRLFYAPASRSPRCSRGPSAAAIQAGPQNMRRQAPIRIPIRPRSLHFRRCAARPMPTLFAGSMTISSSVRARR